MKIFAVVTLLFLAMAAVYDLAITPPETPGRSMTWATIVIIGAVPLVWAAIRASSRRDRLREQAPPDQKPK